MGHGGHRGLAVVDDHAVGQVGGHDEVVLDDERGLLRVQHEPAHERCTPTRGSPHEVVKVTANAGPDMRTDRLITRAAMMRCSESR